MKNINFDLMRIKNEVLAGFTVSLALIPGAISFAFICHVSPLVGLYTASIVALVTSLIGGRPGMISGGTAAVAVVFAGLVISHGVEYLFAAVVLMGVMQVLAGLLKFGKYIRFIPHPVMLGFLNGLAILIFIAQLREFKDGADKNAPWITGVDLYTMITLVALTMVICLLLPKISKAVPASLVAILTVTGISVLLQTNGIHNSRTVLDFVQMLDPEITTLKGGIPSFHEFMVPWSLEKLSVILPYSFLAASVGIIDSLLVMSVVDEMSESRGKGNRECVGLGIANVLCGLLGGMGGCGMIGESIINYKSGGRGRLSCATAGISLLFLVIIGWRFIQIIPLAALVGVMFVVVVNTFEWSTIRQFNKIPRSDALIVTVVTFVTVIEDLATAVFIGVVFSALVFAWKKGSRVDIHSEINRKGSKVYKLRGEVFFGSAHNFGELFNPSGDPDDVIIDFHQARVHDQSGIEAINKLASKYTRLGKKLHLVDLSPECCKLLETAGDMVDIKVYDNMRQWHIASDKLD